MLLYTNVATYIETEQMPKHSHDNRITLRSQTKSIHISVKFQ